MIVIGPSLPGRRHIRPLPSPCGSSAAITRWAKSASLFSCRCLFLLAAALVYGLVGAVPAALAAPSIVGAKVSQHEAMTRLVLVVSESVPFQVFTLSDPDRVVIDLPDVDWAVSPRSEAQSTGVFQRLRHGRFRPGTSRVVVDCRESVVIRDSELVHSGPRDYRLIIDLEPRGSATVAQLPPAAPPQRPSPAADGSPVLLPAHDQASAQVVGQTGFAPVIGATGLAIGDVGPVSASSRAATERAAPSARRWPSPRLLRPRRRASLPTRRQRVRFRSPRSGLRRRSRGRASPGWPRRRAG